MRSGFEASRPGGSLGTAQNRRRYSTHFDPARLADDYHGVSELSASPGSPRKLCYSAGVLVLSEEFPQVIRFRSRQPVLIPELPQEREGIVANVVFPTGIDRRDDLGSPDRFDVYYGMADNRIGVARLDVPMHLSSDGLRDQPEAKI